MSDTQGRYRDPLYIPLNDPAADMVAMEGEWFARVLATQARINANIGHLDLVSVKHVRDASAMMTAPPRGNIELQEIVYFVTGILAGIFWPFLIQEMRTEGDPNTGWLVFFGIGAGASLLLTGGLLVRALWIATRHSHPPQTRPSQSTEPTVD